MEAIGDITASAEVSRVAVDGEEFDTRIQGGVLVRLISIMYGQSFIGKNTERWYRRILLRSLHSDTPVNLCTGMFLQNFVDNRNLNRNHS